RLRGYVSPLTYLPGVHCRLAGCASRAENIIRLRGYVSPLTYFPGVHCPLGGQARLPMPPA
ncbi:MAG: hypothetical protein FWC70_04915, partial [Defluviitaleaceae bacterium]|nr:hypothetical protein [Defluviitaleaceae bacterium]